MSNKSIRVVLLVAGVFLWVLGLMVASAAPAATGPAGVKAAVTTGPGVQICQRPLCRLRCRTFVRGRRCRPGSVCRFKSHVICRCYYQRGTCSLRCKSRPVVRRCNRAGFCRAPVRRCQCGVPMVRPGPR